MSGFVMPKKDKKDRPLFKGDPAQIVPGSSEEQYLADMDNYFTYHSPGGTQAERYVEIRSLGRTLARSIVMNCPQGPFRWEAINKLREAVMWANAAIACGEE